MSLLLLDDKDFSLEETLLISDCLQNITQSLEIQA